MQPRSRRALIFFGILVVLLGILQTPLLHRVRGGAWNTWAAVVNHLFHFKDLTVTDTVTTQLQQLQAENIRLKSQLREYKQLKDQIGLPTFESFRTIPAALVGRPVDTFRTELVLNRGTADGVTNGSPVVIYGSTLLGFITDVHEHTAVLQLLLHPSTSLPAQVAIDTAPQGLLIGQRYTSLALTTIPRDTKLTPGDDVVTVGSDTLPNGLRIGTIASVHNEQNEAYQQAILTLPYDPSAIRAVTILVLP